MALEIEGRAPIGGGTNRLMIGDDSRAYVDAVNREAKLAAAEKGDGYWIHSHFVPLTTTASYSGILYLKNDHPDDEVHIGILRTCGTGTGYLQWQIHKNPTTGTLISAGTAITPVNAKFLSNNTMNATAIKGVDGATITDGTIMGTWTDGTPGHSTTDLGGTIIVGPGDSVAIDVKPSVATEVCTTWQVWTEAPHVIG